MSIIATNRNHKCMAILISMITDRTTKVLQSHEMLIN